MKVLISDNLHPKGLEILQNCKELEVDLKPGMSPDELKKVIGDYDGIAIRSGTKLTDEIISNASNLKVICRAGIGVDNVDVKKATEAGVVVMNTPTGNNVTTAEHTISLLMSLVRSIPQATQSLKEGRWDKKKFMGVELMGKTFGVLGLGNIGGVVANRALGLKMHVVAYDPFLAKEVAEKRGVELLDFKEVLKTADFLTIHVPLSEATRHLIGKKEIKMMKDGAYLINCARGGLVDEAALLDALESGKLSGAALDVFEQEPPAADYALIKHPNVICTPHLGAATEEAQENVSILCGKQLIDFLTNGVVANAINLPSVTPEQAIELHPFQVLAEKLGKFQGQLIEGGAKKITLEYHGALTKQDLKPLTLSYLKGYFSCCVEQPVSEVNAPLFIKERGIELIESTTSKSEEFTSLIRATLTTDKEKGTVAGTIFRNNEPRIVNVDDSILEALPEGVVLVVRNDDRPGVVGQIGTVLGENGINISRMQLGLDPKAKHAIALINVDADLSPPIMEQLKGVQGVLSVKQLTL